MSIFQCDCVSHKTGSLDFLYTLSYKRYIIAASPINVAKLHKDLYGGDVECTCADGKIREI